MRDSRVALTSSLECISETESIIVLGEVELKRMADVKCLLHHKFYQGEKAHKHGCGTLNTGSFAGSVCLRKLHPVGHTDLTVTSFPSLHRDQNLSSKENYGNQADASPNIFY